MIDMSSWETREADVTDDLRLDIKNVRLDELPDVVPEADIINDLFKNEKAFELVEGITKVGFLTHELPIVVVREGEFVVVEGNRRVAALKAIQNPFLAPDFQTRITRLAQKLPDRDSLQVISVLIAPNQDDADQLIAALHTGNQRLAWSPTRQAAFFQAQVDAGKTVKQLMEQYPTVDVKKFVVRSRILQLFRSIRYKDAELADYTNKRRFPVSVLARLYDNDEFLALAEVEVDEENGTATLSGDPGRFALLAEKIIGDIKAGYINTRTLNKISAAKYVSYMNELRDLVGDFDPGDDNDEDPDAEVEDEDEDDEGRGDVPRAGNTTSCGGPESSSSSSTTTSAGASGGSGDSAPVPKAPNTQPKPSISKYLTTVGLSVPAGFPPAIHLIFRELAEINLERFPNASLDLVRTFMEKAIKAYAESLNEEIRATSNNGSGFVYYGNCLEWLEQHLRANGPKALIQVALKVRNNKVTGYVSSVDHLNAINHNHEIFATAAQVREAWLTLLPLVKVMLKQ